MEYFHYYYIFFCSYKYNYYVRSNPIKIAKRGKVLVFLERLSVDCSSLLHISMLFFTHDLNTSVRLKTIKSTATISYSVTHSGPAVANKLSTPAQTSTYCIIHLLTEVQKGLSVCTLLSCCLFSKNSEWEHCQICIWSMYISTTFNTHITGSELCMWLLQWRCWFYTLVRRKLNCVFSCDDAQGPGPLKYTEQASVKWTSVVHRIPL